jgi:hypothetical protein
MRQQLEMIDWSERFPQASSRDIAIRQSTICLCGKCKEIGVMQCNDCQRGRKS